MSGPTLVLIEIVDGAPDRLSLEAITFATGLGAPVHGAIVGTSGAGAAAAGLGAVGVAEVAVVEDDRLDAFSAAAVAAGLAAIVAQRSPAAVVAPGSDRATEVLAHLAARLDLAMAANVIAATPADDGAWTITRQRWAGSLLEEAHLDGAPKLLTVAAHAVPMAAPIPGAGPAVVAMVGAEIHDADLRARVTGTERTAGDKVSLAEAKVVVGGGRGMGSGEAFALLDELADTIGAAVGVSRVATSLGWRPHAQQIGQTGTRIAPELYIACGISGAIQHIVGCKAAKRILVINTDKDAPILGRATYAILGDVHQVVPAITAEVRRATGR